MAAGCHSSSGPDCLPCSRYATSFNPDDGPAVRRLRLQRRTQVQEIWDLLHRVPTRQTRPLTKKDRRRRPTASLSDFRAESQKDPEHSSRKVGKTLTAVSATARVSAGTGSGRYPCGAPLYASLVLRGVPRVVYGVYHPGVLCGYPTHPGGIPPPCSSLLLLLLRPPCSSCSSLLLRPLRDPQNC